ncbi:MAG: hypothetical protein ACRDZ7_07700 [Acidimicrobiia bacterium]
MTDDDGSEPLDRRPPDPHDPGDRPLRHRVVDWALVSLPVMVCLVLAAPHAQALRQARGFLSGVQLSPGEQATFAAWNRTLVLRDVGIPEPASVRSIEDRPVPDDEDREVVIAVATTFVLAGHPGPDPLLPAIVGRFEDNGFRRNVEHPADPLPLSAAAVTLRRRGVTVSLRTGPDLASIEVHRDW